MLPPNPAFSLFSQGLTQSIGYKVGYLVFVEYMKKYLLNVSQAYWPFHTLKKHRRFEAKVLTEISSLSLPNRNFIGNYDRTNLNGVG